MRFFLTILILFNVLSYNAYSKLLINEFVTNTESDWVELYLYSQDDEHIDISNLFVTMYYGTNGKISDNPITLYSNDKADTNYDDRFIVIYLNKDGIDEDDEKGDLNHNGIREAYCNNYIYSLWNTDGVVAIDTDDDPGNGGIIDFVAYCNNDGSLNRTINGYIIDAVNNNQWLSDTNLIDIGEGLLPYQSIIRKNFGDTNSASDFTITNYISPGKPNILPINNINRLIKLNSKILLFKNNVSPLELFLYFPLSFKVRLFNSLGFMVYESNLITNNPGTYYLNWSNKIKKLKPGLYLGVVESYYNSKSEKNKFYCIIK